MASAAISRATANPWWPVQAFAHPALTATLTQDPDGESNIRRVAVTLPASVPLDLKHIRTVCTRAQFASDQCPARSIYGYARAVTPLPIRAA